MIWIPEAYRLLPPALRGQGIPDGSVTVLGLDVTEAIRVHQFMVLMAKNAQDYWLADCHLLANLLCLVNCDKSWFGLLRKPRRVLAVQLYRKIARHQKPQGTET